MARSIALIALAIICIGFGAYSLTNKASGKSPGKLDVLEPLITWHSPSPEKQIASEDLKSRFQLTNREDLPVHVTSVESGCGCATPTVSPMTIEPGRLATVEVEAKPLPFGERTVAFWIGTDSPATPKILLKMRIIGYRRPPLLAQASGDLTFRSGDAPDESRELVVRTVEPVERGLMPIIDNKISFLYIDEPIVLEEPYIEEGAVLRTYTYKVRTKQNIPAGTHIGEILVVDPWEKNHTEPVPVSIKQDAPIRVTPDRLVISIGSDGIVPAPAKFLVVTGKGIASFSVDEEGGQGGDLDIERIEPEAGDRVTKILINVAKDREISPGTRRLTLRAIPEMGPPSIVTIDVRKEDRDAGGTKPPTGKAAARIHPD